jgi:signal transduction histidine kinase
VESKITLRKEPVEVATMINTVLETCRSSIEVNGLHLTVTLPKEPLYVDADPVRLSQIAINLMNNAVKFNEPGGQIELTVESAAAHDIPSAADEMILRIRDSGIGIPAESLPRIFDMFYQQPCGISENQPVRVPRARPLGAVLFEDGCTCNRSNRTSYLCRFKGSFSPTW